LSKALSIVIVTWNSEDEIGNCLNSIFIEETSAHEIIVVDNDSSDSTKDILKGYKDKIKLILNSSNTGYTKACNQGIEASTGDFVLLLNPDTLIVEDALDELVSFLNRHTTAGAAAPQLLNEDLSIQDSCRTLPTYWDMFCEMSLLSAIMPGSRVFSRWKMRYFDHDSMREVEQPMAAALLIRKETLSEIGNMDERYKMFFNDVDLCKKILDSGCKIIFYPDAKIIHAKGKSVYKDHKRMIKIWNSDCLKYFKKHHYNFILYPLLSFGIHFTGFFRAIFAKSK
jgi:hypothetical protein